MIKYKLTLLLALVLISLNALAQVEHFTITGVADQHKRMVTLELWSLDLPEKQVLDTAYTDETGYFLMETEIEPGLYKLKLAGKPTIYLALDKGQKIEMRMEQDLGGHEVVTVRGSKDTDLLKKYEAFRKVSLAKWMNEVRAQLRKAKKEGDPEKMAELQLKEQKNYLSHRSELTAWVKENMGTSIAVWATSKRWTVYDLPYLEELEQNFAEAHPGLKVTEQLLGKIERFKNIAPGRMAPGIGEPDTSGTTRQLSDLLGNYVLIDFWASWCGPCRRENPVMVELYATYHTKGFEIYSISLDTRMERWRKAIETDGITWTQVSQLKSYFDDAAYMYNVTAIPSNILLDRKGKIIGYNLFGSELKETLIEIFGE